VPTKQHKEIKSYSEENFKKCCVICWRHAVTEIVIPQTLREELLVWQQNAARGHVLAAIFSISNAP
jgi:hypothetical protein